MCIVYFLPFRERAERPEEWVPAEAVKYSPLEKVHDPHSEISQVGEEENGEIVDIFAIHSEEGTGNFKKVMLSFTWHIQIFPVYVIQLH